MIVDLINKVAIVTGAAGGVGAVYAKALAQSGAQVIVADVNANGAEETAAALRAAGHAAQAFGVDITDPEQTQKLAEFAQAQCGGVDILVNNAAFMKAVGAPLLTYPLELWRTTMDVNVSGTLHCIRAVAPLMIARGGGRIVNQTSVGAYEGGHAYGISKLAVQGMTVWFAQELGGKGITVNCIAPGMINTPAGDASRPPGMLKALTPMIPLKPLGEPEDLVGTLLYLVSDASAWVTGQIIRVDGGWIKRVT
jgi:NAD(P)-dependent dehydrogenase (short-subunit alcohol dehydrogenase family)